MIEVSRTEVLRRGAGVQIEGMFYAITVLPVRDWRADGDPALALTIDARSSEWADWVRLTTEGSPEFTREEIELVQTGAGADELRALHVDDALPGFRTGFTLALEPGMRAYLETELLRVERVTRLAHTLSRAVEAHLDRQLTQYNWTTLHPHEAQALASIAANVVLDGRTPERAIHLAVLTHDCRWAFSDPGDDPQYAELGAALRQHDVLALLSDAGKERISSHE